MSPTVNTVPGMVSSRFAVSESPVLAQSAMSPAPAKTTGGLVAMSWTATVSQPVIPGALVTPMRTLSRPSAEYT